MSKKTNTVNAVDSFRQHFAAASENYSLARVVAEDAEPLPSHRDKNLATRARISAKFSALEDVDVTYLSQRMEQSLVERIPQLPVKLQDRVIDAVHLLRGVGKGQTNHLLRTVMEIVEKKPGLTFTALCSSVAAAVGYTPDTAKSRARNAVNSLIALGVIESTNGMSFSTKSAAYKPADSDFAKECFNNLS